MASNKTYQQLGKLSKKKFIRSRGEIIGDVVIYTVLIILTFLSILPIWHVLNLSLSNSAAASTGKLMLWPKGFTLESYGFIFKEDALIRSFGITIFITIVGTALNMFLTTTCAYALSRKELVGRKIFTWIVIFPMLFSAGIVPGYMLVRNLGLINSVWAMILPGAISAFNVILMKNFFEEIPESLIESARLDGASEFIIFSRIVLPLAVPAIATISLFYAVGHWNEFFRGIFYITDPAKWPLQVLLRNIVVQADFTQIGMTNADMYAQMNINQLTIRAATVISTIIPIALVYPFIQRYFVKGIKLGAEKG